MKSFLACISGLLMFSSVLAEGLAPDALVKNISNDVLAIVRIDKDIQSGNTKKAVDLVEVKILPHFDFMHMTKLALGREWRQATPVQRKALATEFQTLLVRTYSKALTEYKNQTIEFKPFTMQPGATDAKVRTEVKQPGAAKPFQLDYYLDKSDAGWKVYDVEVGGISLVTTYRESFTTEIRNSGIDGLIKSLRDKNQSGDSVVANGKK
jgi:phospholipid transport system substrate-binding protein